MKEEAKTSGSFVACSLALANEPVVFKSHSFQSESGWSQWQASHGGGHGRPTRAHVMPCL